MTSKPSKAMKIYPFKAGEIKFKMIIKTDDDVIHSKALINGYSELEKKQKEQLKLIEQYHKQLKKIEDKPSQMK